MASLARSLVFSIGAGVVGYAVGSLLRQKEGESRPLAKSAVRAGLLMFQRARQTVGELTETASDIIAEARAELDEEREHDLQTGESKREQIFPFAMRSEERKAHG